MARTYAQAQAGLLPDEPILVVGQPTVVDPSRAPEGKHVLWVQVRMAPGTITGDAQGEIAATDWAAAAEPFAERALAILEAHAPGTRAKILGQRIVTPLELEADNPNLVGGDQVCGSHHLSQHFLFRPAARPCRRLHPDHGPAPDRGRRLARRGNRGRIGLSSGPKTGRRLIQQNQPTGKPTMNLNRRSLLKLSAASVALGMAGLPVLRASHRRAGDRL